MYIYIYIYIYSVSTVSLQCLYSVSTVSLHAVSTLFDGGGCIQTQCSELNISSPSLICSRAVPLLNL